jgi:hypothetical protein
VLLIARSNPTGRLAWSLDKDDKSDQEKTLALLEIMFLLLGSVYPSIADRGQDTSGSKACSLSLFLYLHVLIQSRKVDEREIDFNNSKARGIKTLVVHLRA